jgi:hypothetical protein
MLERDIELLVSRDAEFDLSALQNDIWTRHSNLQSKKAATRRLVSWQAVVMVFAIVGSATVGSSLAIRTAKDQSQRTLLDAASLVPSSLLFGAHP